MEYVLFVGHKVGYLALQKLVEKEIQIRAVVIEKEHKHEVEQYFGLIADLCSGNGIPFFNSADSVAINREVVEINPDYILIFGYRKLIPQEIYSKAKKACVACHFSYLPEYRGFAPVNWAVINGENRTGLTFFHLAEEMDNGDIVAQAELNIHLEDDVNSVFDRAYERFCAMLGEIVDDFQLGIVKRIPQQEEKATYTCSRSPEDGLIDWNMGWFPVYNLIRGLTYPFPGAFTFFEDKKLFIWSAEPYPIGRYVGIVKGRIIKVLPNKGVVVLLKDGALLLKEVQFENGERCTADKVLKSIRVKLG